MQWSQSMKRSKRRGLPSVYDIVQYPTDILHAHAKTFTKFSRAADLEDFLHEATLRNQGLAVAANQVGINTRAFFMRVKEKNTFMINPHILDTSLETVVMDEGCLSIPGVVWHVRRPAEVVVEAYDVKGEKFEAEFSGLEARVVFHEIDHLDGNLLPDYLDDEMFDVFIEAYFSNLKSPYTVVELDEEIMVRY
jgi:peptide deformylase